MGPIITGVDGLELSQEERELLSHPLIGGVILFTRNYQNFEQLRQLNKQIKSVNPRLTISVDHEGGRVQRFRDEFTEIPSMTACTKTLKSDLTQMQSIAWLLAAELRACGIDFSYTPVLDINAVSEVIGDRAFSNDIVEITEAAEQFIIGLRAAGVKNVAKHFPGHGSVIADSHIAMPVDTRPYDAIEYHDLVPFNKLIAKKLIDGVMPAHVIFDQVDDNPACFSHYWLQTVLRQKCNFGGAIISDDMGMQGAVQMGNYPKRVSSALNAGCDAVLLCNEKQGLFDTLDGLDINTYANHGVKMASYSHKSQPTLNDVKSDSRWRVANELIKKINHDEFS